MAKPKVIFLLGPTAVGKTEVALKLARKINAEIISCDSMQVYKGMDIISSKPSLIERRDIAHHLIDKVSCQREYNVAAFRNDALKTIKKIIKKGKTPLFVGGSGLYASVVLDGLFKGPAKDKDLRARLYKEAEEKGVELLYKRLKNIDSQAAKKIHPNDLKRIIRALEVYIKTKKPISHWQTLRRGITRDYDVRVFCLWAPRPQLYSRINQRVDEMFKLGLVDEVRRLIEQGLSQTASCAIGVNELKGFLEGKYNLDTARELIKRHTRQYAKRQMTWFRKDKRITWINVRKYKSRLSLTQHLTSNINKWKNVS